MWGCLLISSSRLLIRRKKSAPGTAITRFAVMPHPPFAAIVRFVPTLARPRNGNRAGPVIYAAPQSSGCPVLFSCRVYRGKTLSRRLLVAGLHCGLNVAHGIGVQI